MFFKIKKTKNPNFIKIPAKNTDPSIGDSTWTLGSQKWKNSNGIFTKNIINNLKIIKKFRNLKSWQKLL